jgi:hypothetical protein
MGVRILSLHHRSAHLMPRLRRCSPAGFAHFHDAIRLNLDVRPPYTECFTPMANKHMHALNGLACRKRMAAASSPAACATRLRLRQAFSRTLRSQSTVARCPTVSQRMCTAVLCLQGTASELAAALSLRGEHVRAPLCSLRAAWLVFTVTHHMVRMRHLTCLCNA